MESGKRKKIYAALVAAAVLIIIVLISAKLFNLPSQKAAFNRAARFAYSIGYDYEDPAKIYPFLTSKLKNAMTKEEFVEAFAKERSYPYLTPLFLNLTGVELAGDKMSGVAVYSQAARLPGMVVRIPFVYEKGNYYFEYFTDFPDGSYLDKFDKIPDYLINGWE